MNPIANPLPVDKRKYPRNCFGALYQATDLLADKTEELEERIKQLEELLKKERSS